MQFACNHKQVCVTGAQSGRGHMSGDEAGETCKWGQVMKSLVCHAREHHLYPIHNEKPLRDFKQGSARSDLGFSWLDALAAV